MADSLRFDLLEEKWIPCLNREGQPDEMGLRSLFTHAHELREVRGETPVVTISLYRLLLALLRHAAGPTSVAEWRRLWEHGAFEMAALDAYFESRRQCFDLFDPQRPFFQTAGLETPDPLPAVALFEEVAGGNNATLFDHGVDAPPSPLSFAKAARGLVARQAFALGFGRPPKGVKIAGRLIKVESRHDGPLARGLTLLARGSTLFHTLLLNLPSSKRDADDLPVWDRETPEDLMDEPEPFGRLDLFTFQCRRLLLLPAKDGKSVELAHFVQGRVFDKTAIDPMKPYHKNKESGWTAFSLHGERAVWRDSAALFATAADVDRPHEALRWVSRLAAETDGGATGIINPEDVSACDAFGVATDPGKATSVALWRHERVPLSVRYLSRPGLVGDLGRGLAAAEEVKAALRSAVRTAAEVQLTAGNRSADAAMVAKLADHLGPEPLYWSRLETPFRDFFRHLAAAAGDGEATARLLAEWVTRTLRPAAQRAFEESAGRLGTAARDLRAIAAGRDRLRSGFYKVCEPHWSFLHDDDRDPDDLSSDDAPAAAAGQPA